MQPIEMADSMPAKKQIRRDVMDDAHPQELRDALTCEQTATARYIADITAELARMAGQRQLDLLTYLLNMARVEAEMAARRDPRIDLAELSELASGEAGAWDSDRD